MSRFAKKVSTHLAVFWWMQHCISNFRMRMGSKYIAELDYGQGIILAGVVLYSAYR